MPLSRPSGKFSIELWVTVIVVLVLIGLFMRSFNKTFDEVERLKPARLAAVMEGALRQVHTSWLASNQPATLTLESWPTFLMNEHGYPVDVAKEGLDARIPLGCDRVLDVVAADALPVPNDGWPLLTTLEAEGRCHYRFLYDSGHSVELQYDTRSGKVAVLQTAE